MVEQKIVLEGPWWAIKEITVKIDQMTANTPVKVSYPKDDPPT